MKTLLLIIMALAALTTVITLAYLGSRSTPPTPPKPTPPKPTPSTPTTPTPTPPAQPSCYPGHSTKHTNPKIKTFETYLNRKLHEAISSAMKGEAYNLQSSGAIAIYMKDTPLKLGPVRAWASACGGHDYTECDLPHGEPSFYFGSGTKPITATLVASQLYKLWRKLNPLADPDEFLDWYAGRKNAQGLRGASDALSYQKLFELTSGFKNSQFTESLSRQSNTQAADSSTQTYTQLLQEWLFCCPTGGLITNCPAGTSLFCDNSCDKICPIPLSSNFDQKCSKPLCPDDLCSWAWCNPNGKYTSGRYPYTYSDPECSNGDINPKDPNTSKWNSMEWCSCSTVMPKDYATIFKSLSIYNVAMMRSGIPDSDSIWAIDNAAQLASRTNPIGPVQFVSQIIGFDWDPRWKNGKPVTHSTTTTLYEDTSNPAAMYSSSAYSFLGIILWLLNDSQGRKNWSQIDLNALLPKALYCRLNFAGTEGRHNHKHFRKDAYGNRYYSYEETVLQGGVLHSPQDDIIMGTKQTTLEHRVTEPYVPLRVSQRALRTANTRNTVTQHENSSGAKKAPIYPHKLRGSNGTVNFVDWDSSSGVLDGNSWGPCSGMAEVYMNIFSPTAENPIMPEEIQKAYVNEFLKYDGQNWKSLYNNQIRAPFCLGGTAWSQGATYNCGAMGPDWFYILSGDPGGWYTKQGWKNGTIGLIPCYGHLGDTYGSVSGHVYFPGGKMKAYPPLMNDAYAYVNKEKAQNWSLTFEFSGGLEFTVSQAINAGDDQSTAIQNFVNAVIEDPFDWDSL